MSEVTSKGMPQKKASYSLVEFYDRGKKCSIALIAEQLSADQASILNENQKDLV